MMRIEYDQEADAAYIYLRYPAEFGDAAKTIRANDRINLDFDKEMRLIGIEVLDASEVLSKSALEEAIPTGSAR